MKRITLLSLASLFKLAVQTSAQSSDYEKSFPSNFMQNAFAITNPTGCLLEISQGWGHLMINKSIINDTLRIGNKNYLYGLGTHANSEIKVMLPSAVKRFTAEAGYDKNGQDKANAKSKIIFSVEHKGKILWKSPSMSISDQPIKVDVPVTGKEFSLKVKSEDSNISFCHADWANAQVELESGKTIRLDELASQTSIINEMPLSFVLNGKSSSDFLSSWTQQLKDSILNDRIIYKITWTNPEKTFQLRCEATEFKTHPVVEWKTFFRNISKQNSPVLENVRPLDLVMNASGHFSNWDNMFDPAILHCNKGSNNNHFDHMPLDILLDHNQTYHMESRGGRSSEKFLPFWNMEFRGNGMVAALGWSGDWTADFGMVKEGSQISMKAGMTNLKTYLKPGEEISSPSICLLFWEGLDAMRGNNLFRRYMNDKVIPKWNGKDPYVLAVMGGASSLEGVNEENQKKFIRDLAGTGTEVYWLDAGWYGNGPDGTWWNGRGNWYPEKTKFPHGMRPISDEAHKNGMKFLLWFDPECVAPGTEIAVKHPEYVIRSSEKEIGLFNLGHPEGLKYITDMISKNIIDWNVDVFRNDYNIDPGPYWEMKDEPGRRGITEIRYVEGLYKFWDELRKRKPDLLIDNCASGGRRIDYETCKRSVPLWRSDYECGQHPDIYEASQNQTYGLNMYLPFNSTGFGFTFDKYRDRSIASCSVSFGLYGVFNDGNPILAFVMMNDDPHKPIIVPKEKVKKVFDDMKSYNYLMTQDFYPLTDFSLKDDAWMALQFDSPEKSEGCVICFCRANAPYANAEFKLRAIDPKASYKILYLDSEKELTMLGEQLMKLPVQLNRLESTVIKYKKL